MLELLLVRCFPSAAAALLGVASLLLVACHSPHRQAVLDAAGYPPDFALVFHVDGDRSTTPEAIHPQRRPAQHVLEPGGTLRVALGTGVSQRLHPPTTRRLRSADVARLFRLLDAAHLVPRPLETLEAGDASAGPTPQAHRDLLREKPRRVVVYRVDVTAHGRVAHTVTTPEVNPAAAAVLDELIRLRGGQ